MRSPIPGAMTRVPKRRWSCIFMFGGDDANNVIMPYDGYSDYEAVRSGTGIQIPQARWDQQFDAGRSFYCHANVTLTQPKSAQNMDR